MPKLSRKNIKRRIPKSKKKITKKKQPGFLSWWKKRQQKKKNQQQREKDLEQGINKYKNYRYKSQKLNEAEKFGAKNNGSWLNSKRYGTVEPLKQYLSPKNVNKLLRNLKNKKGMNSTYNINYNNPNLKVNKNNNGLPKRSNQYKYQLKLEI